MSLVQDLLKEVPLSAVLQERVKLAEDRYTAANKEIESLKQRIGALEKENAELRAKIPQDDADVSLSADTSRVLVHLFRVRDIEDRDVGAMCHALGMENGVLKYHLDCLREANLADVTGGNYLHGHVYWALTPAGRKHVVEGKLIYCREGDPGPDMVNDDSPEPKTFRVLSLDGAGRRGSTPSGS
jgi:hypothetical protein